MLYNYLEYCISITKIKNNTKPIQTGYELDPPLNSTDGRHRLVILTFVSHVCDSTLATHHFESFVNELTKPFELSPISSSFWIYLPGSLFELDYTVQSGLVPCIK